MRKLSPTNPLMATYVGITDLLRMDRHLARLQASERADGKTALITGASSGLGFATAVDLGRRGAHVLMADCRGQVSARERAMRLSGSTRFDSWPVDLSDLDSIDELCGSLERQGTRLDLVVLNAAIVPTKQRVTRQGLDEMFVVNYFSSFVLLERLLRSGVVLNRALASANELPADRPRIIFVSSEAHRWSIALELSDFSRPRDVSVGRVLASYGYYKLMLTTFAQELGRRLSPDGEPEVGVFALCPGAMSTNIIREVPALIRPALRTMMRVLFQDPFEADEPVVYLACSHAMQGRTNQYLHRMTPKQVDARASNPKVGRELWEQSVALRARFSPPG